MLENFRRYLVLSLVLVLSGCELESSNSHLSFTQSNIKDYSEARKVFWRELYNQPTKTLYCQQSFNPQQRNSVNVEHVFPMSWVTKPLKCGTRKQCRNSNATFNRIESDLHNLYPALSKINYERGSLRFDMVKGESRRFGEQCDFEVDYKKRAVEPTEKMRGDIARTMFYMAYTYKDQGLKIFKRNGKVLQKWHNQDQPSAEEQQRNQKIEKLQGNRNPFIDDPDLLNRLISQGYFY